MDYEANEETGAEGKDAGPYDGDANGPAEYFGWLSLIDKVSATVRKSWDDVFSMNVYEFFNIVSYLRWRDEREKQRIQRWKMSQ